jgi:uncharacterized OB-fold protein
VTDAVMLPPVPQLDAESEAYWASLAAGTLAVCRCQSCGLWMHPPLERCRGCGGETTLEPVSGHGAVFSFIVVRHASVPGHAPPYVVAVIELDEQAGLRLTGIVHAKPDSVAIGAAVQARIEPIGDSGFSAPAFDLVD